VAHGRDGVARLAQRLSQHVGKLVIVIDDEHARVMTVVIHVPAHVHRPPAGAHRSTDANSSLG
jgi:hypothetical protein